MPEYVPGGGDVNLRFDRRIKDAVQSDLRMCTKDPSFYYTNSLFSFLFHFMFLQSLIVVSW
jgi:hypothetical protein